MPLALTSLGMVSSVGNSVVASCAAIRAGIVRPAPVVGTDVLDLQSGEMVPVTGHPIRGVTEGFLFLGLWVRMAERAIQDLLAHGQLPGPAQTGFWNTCELMVVTPVLDPIRFPILGESVDASLLKEEYAGTLLELTGLPIPLTRVRSFPDGHVGVAAAMEVASRLIESGQARRCLIVAVDSYLEPDTLDWLARRNRLKCGDNPVGLMPGEAGTALLLEAAHAAAERHGHIDAWVQGIAVADTGGPRAEAGSRRDGLLLADLLSSVLPTTAPFQGDLIVDLNGEEWRARAFGGALARLGPTMADARVVLPALSLGEVGAASGGVGVCVAARAFARGPEKARERMVLSLAESGRVAVLRLVGPDGVNAVPR
ncbi:hypothetical protein [Corallococcus terminator]|uniref:Uncharacterized protein n=1 Tax=Corallococcus terminator TaxID=2316733 RepID=A0A3A8J1V6_9BACT|nr:hypothetical protein [Corallococcus terminator]RKG84531.1 hypothetical protein D7V88_21675 [Corallococcus terminator]